MHNYDFAQYSPKVSVDKDSAKKLSDIFLEISDKIIKTLLCPKVCRVETFEPLFTKSKNLYTV